MDQHDLPRLLLAILARDWPRAEALVSAGPPPADLLLDACRETDVHPTIHATLAEAGRLDLVGDEGAAALAAARRKVRHDNLLLVARAEQSLAALQNAGVRPVALKGLDLLHRLYPAFDARTIDDVDLLIRFEDLRAAIDALTAAGWSAPPEPTRTHYVRSSHHLPLDSPEPFPVLFEVHWNLVQEVRFRVDPGGLFERALPLEVGDCTILRLDDHDLVAHLIVHHFTHYFDRRLKWLVDLRLVVERPGFDWDVVVARLREWGARTTAGAVLRHLKKLAPDTIPDRVLEALPVAAWRRALVAPLRSDHPLELYRGTRSRRTQLYLATVMLERPGLLPGWLVRRAVRDRRASGNPLDPTASRGA